MPWSTALEGIVTDSVLTTKLGSYALKSETTTSLNGKVNATDGTASNLQLTNVLTQPGSATSYKQVTDITNDIYDKLNSKASLNGPTVQFSVPVQAVQGGLSSHVVINSQLTNYLQLTGGTITGPITLNDSTLITNDGHLTTAKFVNDKLASVGTSLTGKADLQGGADFSGVVLVDDPIATSPDVRTAANIKYVDSKLAATRTVTTSKLDDYSDKIATTKYVTDKIEQSLTANDLVLGTATTVTPNNDDDSDRIATTEWVREYVAQILEGRQ